MVQSKKHMENDIEAVPSEDNGNVPAEAPSVQPETVTPAEPEVKAQPAEPTPELYELPDGRKVEPSVLVDEYKNLLSDYTRKSQALAAQAPKELAPQEPTANPDYQPQSYEEIFQIAEQRALRAIEAKEQARIQEQQAVENTVISQLNEIKTVDANVNENALFKHAMDYGFRDLKLAHKNMRDMADLAKKVQMTTSNNIAKRNDPVSASPGATGNKPDPSNFSNAVDYLRSLK